jgi:hypothetical protein
LATALAQAAVTTIALIAGMRRRYAPLVCAASMRHSTRNSVSELARLNGVFVAL